ncbi:winged helix-turn-helix transcriptional regulator [Thalassotalea marina]|uniref:OmpR/PhoB-type domain-containing protein n=1 Tax=Thalassotalea marina TaxID=1673741 RepID=A0A919BB22_9GAMM|nr:winged helix-turn-helix transcriptional regulator [Thalassotalea marina]GHF79825.1 hypothetical protein GCM10017161_03780 [Thalassotalea marina]
MTASHYTLLPESSYIRSHSICIDTRNRQVLVDDQPINLTGLSYRLLEVFLLNPGQILSAQTLAKLVWRKDYVSDETIAQRVSLLRKAVGSSIADCIESVRAEGYVWHPNVTIEAVVDKPAANHINKPRLFWGMIVVCLVGAIWLMFYLVNKSQQEVGATEAENNQNLSASPLFARAQQLINQHTFAANALAINILQQYLDKNPQNQDAQILLAQSLIEKVAKFDGQQNTLNEAKAIIDTLTLSPQMHEALPWLEGYFYDVAGQINKAITHYEKALSHDYGDKNKIASALAYLYVQKGKLYEALNLNLTAFNRESPYKFLQVAELLYLAGMEPEAQQWLNLAYTMAPNDNFTAVTYAKSLIANKNYTDAQQVINKLHQVEPATEDSLVVLAVIHIHADNNDLALKVLDQAITLSSTSMKSAVIKYWLEHQMKGQTELLKPEIEVSAESWPNLYVYKSMVQISDGDLPQALSTLKMAVDQGYLDHKYLKNLPPFNVLTDHKVFQEILNEMEQLAQKEANKIKLLQLPKVD